jgi:CRP/FNR family transcriptional regulator, cyclic AMP receptor protein
MTINLTLKMADIFFEMTQAQLDLIAAISDEKTYQPGDIIFEENTPSSELYVIDDGEVEIQVDPDLVGKEAGRAPQTIAKLRRGQSFGEVALVDEGVRSARARCAYENTKLVIIPRQKLMHLCDTNPDLGYRLMRNLAADLAMKIRNTDLQMREYLTWTHRQ